MSKYNINELLKKAESVTIPTSSTNAHSGGSKLSFGIVNSKSNGKRLTFSKALAAALELEGDVQMVPMSDEDLLMVGKHVPHAKPMRGKLSDCEGRKVCYDSANVAGITEVFGLTFGKHTSQSFDDIEIDAYGDSPIALIHIVDKYAGEKSD